MAPSRKTPLDAAGWQTALEAQFVMGHCAPSRHVGRDPSTVSDAEQTTLAWAWDADEVRQALHVPANAVWDQRVLELEINGLAEFVLDMEPITWDAEGTETVIPGWRDEPRERWGYVDVYAPGVLRLAELYGRPYVRVTESPALLAHWRLVHAENHPKPRAILDEAQWAREWPEQAILWQAKLKALHDESDRSDDAGSPSG